MDKKEFRVLIKHCFLTEKNTVEAKQWLDKISEVSVFRILHESFLEMRKLFSKWVLRSSCSSEVKRIFCVDVTINETGIHDYKLETKRSSAEWTAAGESRPKQPKTQKRAGKVMASVFWDAHDILFIDYLEKGKTINNDYYMVLLDRLIAEIKKKRPHMQKKKVLFHQDNEPN